MEARGSVTLKRDVAEWRARVIPSDWVKVDRQLRRTLGAEHLGCVEYPTVVRHGAIAPDLLLIVATEEEQDAVVRQRRLPADLRAIYLAKEVQRHAARRTRPFEAVGQCRDSAKEGAANGCRLGRERPVQKNGRAAVALQQRRRATIEIAASYGVHLSRLSLQQFLAVGSDLPLNRDIRNAVDSGHSEKIAVLQPACHVIALTGASPSLALSQPCRSTPGRAPFARPREEWLSS